jgi:hypothetical protein
LRSLENQSLENNEYIAVDTSLNNMLSNEAGEMATPPRSGLRPDLRLSDPFSLLPHSIASLIESNPIQSNRDQVIKI